MFLLHPALLHSGDRRILEGILKLSDSVFMVEVLDAAAVYGKKLYVKMQPNSSL